MKTFAETMVELESSLDKNLIETNYNGQKYIAGYVAINHANKVFGYDGWSYKVRGVKDVTGEGLYEAIVEVTVKLENETVQREDVGTCVAAKNRETGVIAPESHETAIKGSVTDALKRALRTFGEQFGNTLYDKDFLAELKQDERSSPRPTQPQQRQAASQSTAKATTQTTQANHSGKSQFRLNGEASTDPSVDLSDVPANPPPCPHCGGEMWDNIAGKFWSGGLFPSGAKKPVFTCKDKECKNDRGFVTAIFADTYQNGVLPDSYYAPGENPNTSATPPETAPPVAEDTFPDEAQVVDLEFKAEKIWGPGAWLEGLRQTSLAMIGTEGYATASPEQLNKLQGFIDTVKPGLEKAA